ncbi:MAG: hypothetical protein U9N49_04295, partial [Campylobacterota bacterium]|nr:hypothetical protein [Campylobacterota bacterium]
MDLKRKILSLILFFISIITLTIYINYQTHKNYYYELIEYSIDSIIDKVRFDIQKADRIVAQITNFKKDIYYTIHQKAHEELKANPHLDINKLKSKLLEYLPSSKFMDIHLYLINPHYIIYNTTYKIDLGLDMSNMKGAQEYIDSAFNEVDTIHFAIAPSFDIMTNEYRLYSYSAINEY